METQKHILPNDVLAILKIDGKTTRSAIAKELGCSVSTVTGKIGRLVQDGENIRFDQMASPSRPRHLPKKVPPLR